jgi:hypothetical protein
MARETISAVEARHAAFVPRFAISGAFARVADSPPTARAPRNTSLADEFEQSGGSVLLVDAPAAGTTTALLAFTRSLAAAALESADAPIPCLASIPTWDGHTKVGAWLEEQTPPEVRGVLRQNRRWTPPMLSQRMRGRIRNGEAHAPTFREHS